MNIDDPISLDTATDPGVANGEVLNNRKRRDPPRGSINKVHLFSVVHDYQYLLKIYFDSYLPSALRRYVSSMLTFLVWIFTLLHILRLLAC